MTGAFPEHGVRAAKGGFPYPARTVAEWPKEAKPIGPAPRKMPDDFPQVGPTLTLHDGMRRWKAGQAVVRRWHRENGSTWAPFDTARRRNRKARPAPQDFAKRAADMDCRQLCAHYRCGTKTLQRWRREAGVPARKQFDAAAMSAKRWAGHAKQEFKRQPPARRKAIAYTGPKSSFTMKLPRDSSIEGQAADHLRRDVAVYRCNERGGVPDNADPKSLPFWRVGNVVMTPEELIERAERKGFILRAWARIGEAISGCEADRVRRVG